MFNITSENARALAIKGNEAKRAKRLAKELAGDLPKGISVPLNENGEMFRETMLKRVREHTKKLQDKIDDVLDRRDLDIKAMRDLAFTIEKLEQVEQRLSNRPLPGSFKPTAQKPQRRDPQPEPMPTPVRDEPMPVPVPPVTGEWSNVLF